MAMDEVRQEDEKQNNLVTLMEEMNEVIIGDNISLTGKINSSLYGTSPSDVIILISAPAGSHADSFNLAKTSHNGSFQYNQVADIGGDWNFEALYTGMYSNRVSVAAVPGDEPKKTALTLSGWPTFPKVGDLVTFKGRLSDSEGKGIGLKPVTYRLASSPIGCIGGCAFGGYLEWRDAGTTTTDMSGEYSFTLPVVESGSVQIETIFPGDDGYSSSNSRILKITVYE
ncbi:MAG: hypothetical protein GXY48_00690 [Methanomicrobiales archaeon]|nr:hypothetical protein [Methanomicrobiales archaeon]